ncbi:hypothetical protein [Comamonas koreensis]|uniref:hypothetical protein n=1 Tax=Comamonas koreensis TaxID=160825 RepID=UPI0015FC4A8E|nr:hypothetical protein [Comamonas koreensis]
MSTAELQTSSSTTNQTAKPKELTAEQKDQLNRVQEVFRGSPLPPTDPSAITLTLQARGERFAQHVDVATETLGFHTLNDHFAKGFKNHDTERSLAYISGSMGRLLHGPGKTATVFIEPEKHLMEFATAGSCFIEMLTQLADALEAVILNADGAVLSEAELKALGEQINAGVRKKMQQHRAAHTVVMPDGEVRLYNGLSFTYDVLDAKGDWDHTVYFDAAPATVSQGRANGLNMAAELMKFHKAHKRGFYWFGRVLEAAYEAKKKDPRVKYSKPCVENVVAGFMTGIEAFVQVGCKHTNVEWINARIDEAEQSYARDLAEKAEFAERMRNARAAAAAKRSAAAQGGSSK